MRWKYGGGRPGDDFWDCFGFILENEVCDIFSLRIQNSQTLIFSFRMCESSLTSMSTLGSILVQIGFMLVVA